MDRNLQTSLVNCDRRLTMDTNTTPANEATTLPKGFCLYPWIGSHVSTDGNIAPCCEFDGEVGSLKDTTLNEVWNGKKLAEVRADFIAGKSLKACWKCHDREQREGSSMRLEAQAWYPEWYDRLGKDADRLASAAPEFPVMLDLRFSNLCNFSCRSCWHGSSSSWFKDGQAIGVTAGGKAEIRSFKAIDDVVQQIGSGLDTLEELYFAGGEPLMMAEHYSLLKLLVERGQTGVFLRYNTNLSRTEFAGTSIFDLWSKFDKVMVYASVDAVGAEGALVRNGFNWNTFVENIGQLRRTCPSAVIRFGVTVSVLNILSLPELLEALVDECGAAPGDIHLHSLQEPDLYRSQVLPARLKRQATAQIRDYIRTVLLRHETDIARASEFSRYLLGVVHYMNSSDLTEKLPQFRDMMKRLDALRSQNSKVTLPKLRSVLDDGDTENGSAG